MDTQSLTKVLALAGAHLTVDRPSEDHWNHVEEDLGVNLPLDFKELVSALGDGYFGDLCLLNPASRSTHTLCRATLLRNHDALSASARESEIQLFPDPGGFLCLGFTGNAMYVMVERLVSSAVDYSAFWWDVDRRTVYDSRRSLAGLLHDAFTDCIVEEWAKEMRNLVWGPDHEFFTSLHPDEFLQRCRWVATSEVFGEAGSEV
jgi:hypothetical protein